MAWTNQDLARHVQRGASLIGGRLVSDVPPAVHTAPTRIPTHTPTVGEGDTRPTGAKANAAYQARPGLAVGMSSASTGHTSTAAHLASGRVHQMHAGKEGGLPSHNPAAPLDEHGLPYREEALEMSRASVAGCPECRAYVRKVHAQLRAMKRAATESAAEQEAERIARRYAADPLTAMSELATLRGQHELAEKGFPSAAQLRDASAHRQRREHSQIAQAMAEMRERAAHALEQGAQLQRQLDTQLAAITREHQRQHSAL